MRSPSNLTSALRRLARESLYSSRRLPLVGPAIEAQLTHRFNTNRGAATRLFNGIYADFAGATRAIPSNGNCGYDNEPSARRVLNEWLLISPSDYPVLFWLSRLLADATFVFDWGGNVGLKYFAYEKYLSYSPRLTWCVNDVPIVVAAGEEIARREAANALRFTTTFERLPQADILLAAGVLHFIEKPFEALRAVPTLPPHVLLSKVPAYDRPAAVTLQNMGSAFCPNHLFNRAEFVQGFIDLGYRLVDDWVSPELTCDIPFHPEHSISGYAGFYFTRSGRA